MDKTFIDIRVSLPNCLSNRTKTLKEVYEKNENEKKDEYLEGVLNAEKATFTLAVFLTSGCMSNECKQFIHRLADLIARKRKKRYCDVVRHVRTRIRFAMLRTTLIALHGYRGKKVDSKHGTPLSEVTMDHFRYPCIVLCQLLYLI